MDIVELAAGLRFPEGPIALDDGSVLLVEIERQTLTRVDLATGRAETLYDSCDGRRPNGPNDIVFDRHGGFWFTDLGKTRARDMDRGAVYYALPDGSFGPGVSGQPWSMTA